MTLMTTRSFLLATAAEWDEHPADRRAFTPQVAAAKLLATNGAVAYGPSQLAAAQEASAIETLVIAADLLRDTEANIAGKSWSHFAAGVTDGGGELVQASTDHDAGQQLVGMGGALALLRWKIDD